MPTSKKPTISFPRDERPHPERLEWWYWNANLEDADGKSYSAMFTLFRSRPTALPDMWSTHEIVSSDGKDPAKPSFHLYTSVDHAEWTDDYFSIGVQHAFRMEKKKDGEYHVVTPDMNLRMTMTKPPILIGGTGLVDLGISKTFYYTLPRLEASGTIRVGAKRVHVRGLAWMDHQWHPITVSPETVWKWFSMHLSDGTDIQCFEFGKTNIVRMATVSWPDGTQSVSDDVRFSPIDGKWKSQDTGLSYQVDWKIEIALKDITLTLHPDVRACEAVFGPVIYWEGPMGVSGKIDGRHVTGVGFFEHVPNADLSIAMNAVFRHATQRIGRAVRHAAKSIFTRAG